MFNKKIITISKDKIIFGCYGGSTEFNIRFVHETIEKIVNERSDIIFLFMNINTFCMQDNTEKHLDWPAQNFLC